MSETTIVINMDEGETLEGKLEGNLKKLLVPDEIQELKVFKQFSDSASYDEAMDLCRKSDIDVRKTIAECEIQIAEETAKRDANENYQKAQQIVKDFNKAFNEAIKPTKMKKTLMCKVASYRNEVKRAK
jgi:hypothetical protein